MALGYTSSLSKLISLKAAFCRVWVLGFEERVEDADFGFDGELCFVDAETHWI
jgi:hypothetical protein